MKLRSIVSLILLLSSTKLFAAELTEKSVPKNLHVYNANGSTYVDHVQSTCGSIRYYIDPGHKKYDAIVALLSSAQISGRDVLIRYEGCINNNQGILIGVYLQ